jgi:tripartite-type tricarboxylate transporter receptor subunit TctC
MMAGLEITHVPYRGSGPSIADILSGNIQMSIDTVSTMLPHIQNGGMRALAVAGAKNPTLPDLPTIAETLPGFDGDSINYITAPAGTPQPILERLHNEFNAILTDPDVAKRMVAQGMAPVVETQADLIKRVKSEQEKWRKVIAQIK